MLPRLLSDSWAQAILLGLPKGGNHRCEPPTCTQIIFKLKEMGNSKNNIGVAILVSDKMYFEDYYLMITANYVKKMQVSNLY